MSRVLDAAPADTSSSVTGTPTAGEGTSLVQHAMDAVAAYIREQSLRVGDTLPGEGHFADALGVSRAVMREGISRYLSFFNTARPHTAHGGKTPDSAYYAALPAIATAA